MSQQVIFHQIGFLPSRDIDVARLRELPQVTAVGTSGHRLVVTGTGDLVAAVMSHLAREEVIAHELRVEQQTLDDAFLALTGCTDGGLAGPEEDT